MAKRVKVYTTKTASSGNILVKYVDDGFLPSPTKVYDKDSDNSTYTHLSLNQVWRTRDAALAAAEMWRQKKIASLEKQLENVRGIEFTIHGE